MAELNPEQLHKVTGGMGGGQRFNTYCIRRGDSLDRIADQTGVPLAVLMEDNFIYDKKTKLNPGTTLYIRVKI